MKISKSKRQLAQLLIEAGVTQFPKGANWAAQDKSDFRVRFYDRVPKRNTKDRFWNLKWKMVSYPLVKLNTLIHNWHQTVLSRDEFDQIVADTAQDADGWIEWLRDELPVEEGVIIDVKYSDGDELHSAPCGVFTTNMTSIRGECASAESFGRGDGSFVHITAYRLHKPEQVETVEYNYPGVVYTGPVQSEFVVTEKPTIEQLATDYRNAKDYAERKQQEADDAKVDADARLKSLEIAGEAIGLLLSPINAKKEPELVIAVQVGDEVECAESNIKRDKYNGMVGRLRTIDESDTSTPYLVDFGGEAKIWCHKVKFIRRP